MRILYSSLIIASLSAPAFANTPAPLKFSSYIDGSANYLSRSNHFISGAHDRVNDIEPNGFTLQQAGATLAWQPEQGLGGLVNVLAGRDALNLAPYGWDITTSIQNIGIAVMQTYVQYTKSSFSTRVGEFDSLAGYEHYNPVGDNNFSRSIISGYAEPGTFLGIRETYAPNTALSISAGLNDGWDTIEDLTRRATLELGVVYTVNPQFAFSLQAFNGQQRATDGVTSGPTGIRNAIDLIATYHATEKLTYVVNYDYGIQNRAALPHGILGTAMWQGAAGYMNYTLNERWQTSFRAEIFSDPNGFRTGVQQVWKEATITLMYLPTKQLTIRAETRRDLSNVNSFLDKNGHGVGNNLQSFGLEVLYVFC